MPWRNLENSSKTPPFCCTTESEENGSSTRCDVCPERSNISRPLISLRMRRNAFQRCYRLLQQYPRFKERYTKQFNSDDRSIVQQKHKRWLILSNYPELSNKRTYSGRTIEERRQSNFVPRAFSLAWGGGGGGGRQPTLISLSIQIKVED